MKILRQLKKQKQVPLQFEFNEDLAIAFKAQIKRRKLTIRSVMEIFAREFIKESKGTK